MSIIDTLHAQNKSLLKKNIETDMRIKTDGTVFLKHVTIDLENPPEPRDFALSGTLTCYGYYDMAGDFFTLRRAILRRNDHEAEFDLKWFDAIEIFDIQDICRNYINGMDNK